MRWTILATYQVAFIGGLLGCNAISTPDRGTSIPAGGTAYVADGTIGNIVHGGVVSIRALGTENFGTKEQGPPIVWDFGDEVYVNGLKVDEHRLVPDGGCYPDKVVWEHATTNCGGHTAHISRSREYRHSRVQAHYFGTDSVYLSLRQKYDRPNSADKLFISWWARYGTNTGRAFIAKIQDIQGTFLTGRDPRDADGESFVLSNGKRGRISGIFASHPVANWPGQFLFGSLDDETTQASDLAGQEIRGLTSGARASFPTTLSYETQSFDGAGSAKQIRVAENGMGPDQMKYTLATSLLQAFYSGYSSLMGDFPLSSDARYPAFDVGSPAEYPAWRNHVLYLDASGSYGKDSFWYDFAKTRVVQSHLRSGAQVPTTYNSPDHQLRPALFGLDISNTVLNNVDFGEIYMDYTPQVVVLGNAPVWSGVTRAEFQRIVKWEPSLIEVVINLGSFESASGLFLYVMDSQFQPVNSAGREIRSHY